MEVLDELEVMDELEALDELELGSPWTGSINPSARRGRHTGGSLLQDRQVVVGDLQDNARHRRRVVVARGRVGPRAGRRVPGAGQQLLADRREPLLPRV